MKNIFFIIIMGVLTSINFNGCSGEDGINRVTILVTYCVEDTTSEALESYVKLSSGDSIIRDEDDTVVEIYHGEDNIKRVCLVNGSAHILRE